MGSLFTGVPPTVHGLQSDRFHIPRVSGQVHPLPRCLRGAGIPTTTYIRCIPFLFRGIADRMSKMLGIADPHFVGSGARDIVGSARRHLEDRRRGFTVLHLPDADAAGHAEGWMSEPYLAAARRLDEALGAIAAYSRVDEDPSTLLIALADHGGGGVNPLDHDSDHPLDRTIPLLVTGATVRPACLTRASLLDVPATVLWSFGLPIPAGYAGVPLTDAFLPSSLAA